MPITIAIAEDNSYALRSCEGKISYFKDLHIAFSAMNGIDMLEQLEHNIPDVVLMDIEMPVMDGIQCTDEVKRNYPQVKVIMLTTFDDDEKIFQAIMAGASGYLLKEESAEYLHHAITDAMNGGAAMSAGIAAKALNLIRNPLNNRTSAIPDDYGLTKREIELLELLKNGMSYEKIATHLFISFGTVRKHIENIYRKLQVNNKVDAIHKAGKGHII